LRDGVVDTMSSPSSGKKRLEGIDMSACRLNRRTNTLKFSGANSSLWVISDSKLIEIKGEKQPVGYHHKMDQPFTEQVLSVNKGDCIYTFTDGILDQFGGPDNKKFGYPRFRKLLLKASTLNILEQKELIHKEIKSWKGDVEQLDDLTVIGLIV
jgi:serine phosphatase RsbU (regulator of sigma subunit)